MPQITAGHVRIVSVQSMLNPWSSGEQVAVAYDGPGIEAYIVLSEQRCGELRLREAARDGTQIPTPIWRE